MRHPSRTGARWAGGILVLAALVAGGMAEASCGPPNGPWVNPDSGEELIGTRAPAWTFTRWIGPAQSLEKLRGKVVLLRWWTTGCHFCETTLPEIETLRNRYGKDGFVAIGVFHPKPPRAVRDADIRRGARERGFHGMLAVDQQWETLNRYWLEANPDRNWTSVSFLIDAQGRIAWVHGGGEYHHGDDPRHARCAAKADELEAAIRRALGKTAATSFAAP